MACSAQGAAQYSLRGQGCSSRAQQHHPSEWGPSQHSCMGGSRVTGQGPLPNSTANPPCAIGGKQSSLHTNAV
jgi:hypothetical protein